jgi:predicted hotdog family 3-hydroxylacyl-ACP dehydratase
MPPHACIRMNDFTPAGLLPHRAPMLLVDEILTLDDRCAVTRSVVRADWPLCDAEQVSAVVLVELVAQTSGIHNGYIRAKTTGEIADRRGWIVGIRRAQWSIERLPVGTTIVVRTENTMEFEGFRDILGRVEIHGHPAAEITLQLLRADDRKEDRPHEPTP